MGVIRVELPQPGDALQVVVTVIEDLHQICVHRKNWAQQLNDLMKEMKNYYEVSKSTFLDIVCVSHFNSLR